MTTAADIINDAALAAGIGDQYNGLDTTGQAIALRAFNRLLDTWSNESLVVYVQNEDSFAMTPAQAVYSTSLLTQRPMDLLYAFVRQSGVDYPIEFVGYNDYARVGYKTTAGLPAKCYYNSGFPNGTLTFFPVPATAYECHIGYRARLTQIAATTDVINVPPGYEQAMVYGLATTLCPLFGTEPTPTCIYHAKSSKSAIKPQNEPLNEAQLGVPLGRGLFNIFQGS